MKLIASATTVLIVAACETQEEDPTADTGLENTGHEDMDREDMGQTAATGSTPRATPIVATIPRASSGGASSSPDAGPGGTTPSPVTPDASPDGTALASATPEATTNPSADPDDTTLASATPDVTTPANPGGTSTSAGSGSAALPMSTCTKVKYAENDNDNSVTGFPGVQSVYFFGDGATSQCATPTEGRLCVDGNAVPAESDYSNWGASVGLQLSSNMSAYDLVAQGVTHVRFKLTGVAGRPIRVEMWQVNDPIITEFEQNYQLNAFTWGGTSPKSIETDGDFVIGLEEFELPSWTRVLTSDDFDRADEVAEGQVLDASKVHALSFQIANNPDDYPTSYTWCVSAFEWIDVNGMVVPLTKLEAAPSASANGESDVGGKGGAEGAGGAEAMTGVGGASE